MLADSKQRSRWCRNAIFQPQNPVQKTVYNPYSFVLAKTAPQSDVVCRCLSKNSDTGVVANTKGEEMMTSCYCTASFASCACCSALSLYQALIPWKDRGGESMSSCKHPCPQTTTSPPKKQWWRSVAHMSIDVNVEWSLSAPVDVERSLRHIMNVSSTWAWHLNRINNNQIKSIES